MAKRKLLDVNGNVGIFTQEIETDIFNGSTPEFFVNMSLEQRKKLLELPSNSPELDAFILEERKKCKEGLNINGVFITGRLYYHLNYHKIALDKEDLNTKKIERIVMNPLLRDNEWIAFNAYEEAIHRKEGFVLGGARQLLKSEVQCSLSLYEINLFRNTEGLLLFTNSPDKQTYTKKAQVAIKYGEVFMQRPLIDNNWKNTEIRFGTTNKDNTTNVVGRLYIYNTDGDNASQIGAGKCLQHGSKVYYADREGVIEGCKVGDRIFGRDGKLTTILGVYPQGEVDMYEITFSDRRKVVCCGEHLWKVFRIDKKPKEEVSLVLNTEQLIKSYKRKYFNKKLNKEVEVNRYKIPNNSCVEYPQQEVTIDPYYLGLWLGDGSTNQGNHLTNIDEEIIKYVEHFSLVNNCYLQSKGKEHRIKSYNTGTNPINKLFKSYGLMGYKHIPTEYLYNSKEIRLEVLRGVLDTDGTIDASGRIEIDLSNKKLHEDVLQLIRSLGINCSTSTKKTYYIKEGVKHHCKLSYRIYLGIVTEEILFKLTRKQNRQKLAIPKQSIQLGASIINIKPVGKSLGTCISVDNEDKLFLTNDFIPTHNTITFFSYDEIAKKSMRESYEAVIPALISPYGLRCSPFLAFTGGNVENSRDAEEMFFHPEAARVMPFANEGKQTGFFMGGWYRQDFKKPQKFKDFLNNNGYNITTPSVLDGMEILVTDFDLANKVLDQEQLDAAKSKDPTGLIKHKMYFPRSIKEMFMKNSTSNFKKDAISQQREYLKSNLTVTHMETKRDIQSKIPELILSSKKPITSYPKESWHDGDAPLCVYDLPRYKGFGVHVIGVDCIREDEAATSDSLGSFYVWRRNHNDLTDPFRDKMVVSYKGRLKTVKEFHEMILDVAEIYDAKILYEHSDRAFLDFFEGKNKTHLLIDAIPIQREINPKSKSSNTKGLRPTAQNKAVLYATTLGLVNEEMEDGILGYAKILDDVLLQELDAYDPDLNMDCYIAFSHVAQARLFYDKFGVAVVTDTKKELFIPPKKQITITSAFGFNPKTIPKQKSAFGF